MIPVIGDHKCHIVSENTILVTFEHDLKGNGNLDDYYVPYERS